jgi:hypothetical protein
MDASVSANDVCEWVRATWLYAYLADAPVHPRTDDQLSHWLARHARGESAEGKNAMSMKNPVLSLPLNDVMRSEIAMPLQQVLQLYTVGCFLRAWRSPRGQKAIEQLFDTPEQARHAAATCAAWLGFDSRALHEPVPAWWPTTGPLQTARTAL